MAEEFANMTGIQLEFDNCHIDSDVYGYIEELDKLPTDDPYAYYVIQFNEVGNNYETVNFIPSLNKVVVWRSISDDNPYDEDACEGAVNPNNGKTEWFDWFTEGAYKLTKWSVYHR